jgi:HPt (histidine-containing phosphotransfer) domain-containing protein
MKHLGNETLTLCGYFTTMAYESGVIEAALAAAVGDDPMLVADLRRALIESAEKHADLLSRARCDANWHTAAWRLKSLSASFGAIALLNAATEALEAAPGDPVAIRKIKSAIDALKA